MVSSQKPKPWDATEVAARIERARGRYLDRTGREIKWADFGRLFGWKSPTVTEVRKGKRPLRVAEIAEIAIVLNVTPSWLAFGQEPSDPEDLADAMRMLRAATPRDRPLD